MNYNELMEQASLHTIAVSEAMRNVELAKAVFDEASDSSMSVAILTNGNGITSIADIIGDDMLELKALATGFVRLAYESRVNDLEKLMGIRKPAVPNPEFERATVGMVERVKLLHQDVNLDDSTSVNEFSEDIHQNEQNELKIENTASQEIDKPWTDRETLYRMYIEEDKTATMIAEELGCKKQDVTYFLYKYGIKKDNLKPGKQVYSKKKEFPSKSK